MKVLIVNPRMFIYGGAELLIVRLCRALVQRGIPHALLTPAIIPDVSKHLPETRVIVAPGPQDVRIYGHLWRIVRKYAPAYDLVNIHNFPAEFAAWRCPRPVVWMCNEPELYLRKLNTRTLRGRLLGAPVLALERHIVRQYVRTAVVADAFNADRFHALYGIRPRIIPYGIDYDYFAAAAADQVAAFRRRWPGRFIILQAGMLTPLKNQIQSLWTLKELKASIPGVLLVLAGFWEPAYKAELDRFIAAHVLAGDVVFTGHIDREELRTYYHACDVLLHPVGAQGGWLAPFEALSAGRPVVVSPEMTAAPMIAAEKIGIVTDRYAEALVDLYQHPEKYAARAQKGREWVRQHLSWNHFCAGMVQVFEETLMAWEFQNV